MKRSIGFLSQLLAADEIHLEHTAQTANLKDCIVKCVFQVSYLVLSLEELAVQGGELCI